MGSLFVVKFGVAAIVLLLTGILVYRRTTHRIIVVLGTAAAGALGFIATSYLDTLPPPHISIEISAPRDESEAQLRTVVQGTVSTAESDVYVFVHPLSTDRWWVQDRPQMLSDGRWQVEVYLGTETVGVGDRYEIVAGASNEYVLLRLFRGTYLRPAEQLRELPQGVAKSNRVVVIRPR